MLALRSNENGEMEREEAENLIYATHRFCADKDKMLAFCEEQTLLEVCENVKRIRLAVGKTFLAHKVAEKATPVNMLLNPRRTQQRAMRRNNWSRECRMIVTWG